VFGFFFVCVRFLINIRTATYKMNNFLEIIFPVGLSTASGFGLSNGKFCLFSSGFDFVVVLFLFVFQWFCFCLFSSGFDFVCFPVGLQIQQILCPTLLVTTT